jgi:outer membrane lipoprotein carrier protein
MVNRRSMLAAVLAVAALLGGGPLGGTSVRAAAANAGKGTALESYLAGLSTWSADFTQSAQDARGKSAGTGRGRLIIVRPGKFRWESAPEGASDMVQLMVADGRNLWSLDRDLEQATVKSQKEALPQSPAALLAGGADLAAAYTMQSGGKREGFEWTRVLPKAAQSDFREMQFGFKGGELARLVVIDKLGQRSTLTFAGVKRNAPVDARLVQFAVPPGVDLIGTPVP